MEVTILPNDLVLTVAQMTPPRQRVGIGALVIAWVTLHMFRPAAFQAELWLALGWLVQGVGDLKGLALAVPGDGRLVAWSEVGEREGRGAVESVAEAGSGRVGISRGAREGVGAF